jgi:hypothetical protein
MDTAGLLLVGAVLFVNGLVLLGHADARNAATINIFVGIIQTIVPLFLLADASNSDDVLNAAPIFLFGLTYLWSGITNLTGHRSTGLGWFCIWVTGMSVAFSAINLFHLHDAKQTIIWLNWGALWAMFWRVLAARHTTRHIRVAGWSALLMSAWTCTAPATLTMIGLWDDTPVWSVIAATVVTVVAVPVLSTRAIPVRNDLMRTA